MYSYLSLKSYSTLLFYIFLGGGAYRERNNLEVKCMFDEPLLIAKKSSSNEMNESKLGLKVNWPHYISYR